MPQAAGVCTYMALNSLDWMAPKWVHYYLLTQHIISKSKHKYWIKWYTLPPLAHCSFSSEFCTSVYQSKLISHKEVKVHLFFFHVDHEFYNEMMVLFHYASWFSSYHLIIYLIIYLSLQHINWKTGLIIISWYGYHYSDLHNAWKIIHRFEQCMQISYLNCH